MKLIIDIPEEDYKHGMLGLYFDCYSMKLHDSILNGTPIPDNATNGDVIKAMFPNIVVEEQSKDVFIVFNMDFQGTPFYKTWWNAPYQKGDK